MAIIVTCTCGKQFKVKDELAGKRGKCAACGRVLSVPTLAPSLVQEKATPSPLRACPTCQEALQPNAVICLNCGHDLRTGKQLPHAKSSAPAALSKASAKAPASPVPLQTSDRPKSSPAGQGGMPLGWLLGLSTIAGLFFGAVGFGLGSVGFERETERVTHYSKFGERTGETGHGTLRFYGITLLKSDDIRSFGTSSNLIAVLIAAVTTGVGAVCGGGCVFVAIRRLTRRGHVVRGGDVT